MDYSCEKIAIKIKQLVKEEGTTLKIMLKDLNLGTNLVYQLSYGSSITAINLAKIADYLDCSVDYLLGRTDIANYTKGDSKTALEQRISQEIKYLSGDDQKIILGLIERLNHK